MPVIRTYAESPIATPSTTSRREEGRALAQRSSQWHSRSSVVPGTSDITWVESR
jgi:hypothetical protein